MRRSYVGEDGFELYVPTEFAAGVYDSLVAAGAALGLRDVGTYAVDALRIERGYAAWGRDIGPDVTPFEAGLGHVVRFDKPSSRAARRSSPRAEPSGPPPRLALRRPAGRRDGLGRRADPWR